MDTKTALENLTIARDMLKIFDVRYFVIGTTLLGAVRDRFSVEWVKNIDIGVLGEDFRLISFARFISFMESRGFTFRFYGFWNKMFVAKGQRQSIPFDIWFYFRHDDLRITGDVTFHHMTEFSFPAELLEELAPVTLYGKVFKAPKEKEAVLSHEYDEWKSPKNDRDWIVSPLNVTRRASTTTWTRLQSYLTCKILGHPFRSSVLPLTPRNVALALLIRFPFVANKLSSARELDGSSPMDPKIALENLAIARDVLTAFGVQYFIMDGTLLGVVREGGFVEWDNDVDIGILAENFTVLSFARFVLSMKGKGFTFEFSGAWGKLFLAKCQRQNIPVDIWFYFRRGDSRITGCVTFHNIVEFSFPAELVEQLAPVTLYGQVFMAPKEKEAVLSHVYGDWKSPKKDWHWIASPRNVIRRARTRTWTRLQSYLACKIYGQPFRSEIPFVTPGNVALALLIRFPFLLKKVTSAPELDAG